MPWYGWVLLAQFALITVAAISLRVLRVSQRGRRSVRGQRQARLPAGTPARVGSALPDRTGKRPGSDLSITAAHDTYVR